MPTNNSIIEVMRSVGVSEYPREACGLVIRVGKKQKVVTCTNTAEDPSNFFRIDPKEYIAAEEQGEVVGVWHTHPEQPARASSDDIKGCNDLGVTWYIIGVYKERDNFRFSDLIIVEPVGDDTPYEGRCYIPNVHDCFTLARDYYRREFGLELSEYDNSENWWLRGFNHFVDNYDKEGFTVVDGEPKVGDCMVIQSTSNVPNHVAVYVGEDKILHHSYNRLSRIDVYSGYWRDHTVYHLRHKSKC